MNDIINIVKKIRSNIIVSEKELLSTIPNGDTIFEYVLKQGLNVKCNRFSKTKSLDIIFKYQKYTLLKTADIKTLLKNNNLNESYLETFIKLCKNNNTSNLSYINPFDNATSLKDTAQVYILYAKNDLIDYLPYLDSELLLLTRLENGKEDFKTKFNSLLSSNELNNTLLELMLSLNRDLVLKKILDKSLRKNFKIAMILRANSIKQNIVDYELKGNNYIKSLVKSINDDYNNIKLNWEEIVLLQTLYNMFIINSDFDAVESLINSYKIQLKNKKPNTIIEIKKLIELKKRGIPSCIKIGNSNQYSNRTKAIEVSNTIIDTINHEMGHVFFDNLSNGKIPDEFFKIIERVRNNKNTLFNVNEFSILVNEKTKNISLYAQKKYEEDFPLMNKVLELYKIESDLTKKYDYYLDERRIDLEKETYKIRNDIRKYLFLLRHSLRKEYLEKGYSEEDINILFSSLFTIKDYARAHKRIQQKEYENALCSSVLAVDRSIGDIIDAIYKGNYLSKNLEFNGSKIIPISGHGLFYYNYNENNIFDEVFANYRTIMMSENSVENLKKLRYYVGDELVDFLDNYYNNLIIKDVDKDYVDEVDKEGEYKL